MVQDSTDVNTTGVVNAGNSKNGIVVEDTFSIKFITDVILSHKLWIVISVIVCLFSAIIYLQCATPLYSRYTSLLVNDSKKNGVHAVSEQFMDMGIFGGNSNVNNELQALQSPHLMFLVIKHLNLGISYEEPHFFRNYDLYGESPISVKFSENGDFVSSSFEVKVLGANKYSLSNFEVLYSNSSKPIKDDTTNIVVGANTEVVTLLGKIEITPNAYQPSDSNRVILVKNTNANALADEYCKRLNVELPDKMATVINLRFKDPSALRAENVLSAIYDMYLQEQIEKKRRNAAVTSKFIDNRLEIIEQELGDIDRNIEKYKSGQLLTNVDAEGLNALQESSVYGQRVLEVNNQLEVAKFIRDYLSSSTADETPKMLPSNAGLNEGALVRQIDEYNNLVMRRERLVANSSEKNPLVSEIDRKTKSMEQTIMNSLDNLVHSLEVQMQGLKGKESQIKQTIARNPKQEKYLQTVGRQQKIKESLYLFLLQKREENELSGTIEAYNLDVITPPRGGDKPISPKSKVILFSALFWGLFSPIFIFWLLETLDETVRSKKDLSSLTLPFLGTIPLTETIKEKKKGVMPVRIVVKDQSRDIVNESFRVLRSNFTFMAEQYGDRVIMLSSFFPNSGKTFLSTNLSLSLALTGKKVVVVDLDMRKAELSKAFGNKRQGVSSFLSGRIADPTSLIIPSGLLDNLDILPCGALPPNPAELLLNDNLQRLIDILKEHYDFIFLDSTPLNIVADAATVGKMADMVIFTIREGRFLREALPDLEQLYQSKLFKRMATVLNGSVSASGSYGRYHRYGNYGRYGHYGHYGHYGEKS